MFDFAWAQIAKSNIEDHCFHRREAIDRVPTMMGWSCNECQ